MCHEMYLGKPGHFLNSKLYTLVRNVILSMFLKLMQTLKK